MYGFTYAANTYAVGSLNRAAVATVNDTVLVDDSLSAYYFSKYPAQIVVSAD